MIGNPKEDYIGLAIQDALPISLSEGVEYALTVSKHYGWTFDYCYREMRYGDLTVLYAKLANDRAFEAYNNYVSLDDEGRAKYVKDWGEPKPYEFVINTPENQRETIEKATKNPLQSIYKRG